MTASRGRGRPPLELDERAVLRAALEAFAQDGPRATSMERVAERCGVAKTTLHDRFGSKSELLDKALEQERISLRDHLLAAYRDGEQLGARAQIRNGYAAFFGWAREHPAAFRLLFSGGGPSTPGRTVVVDAVAQLVRSYAQRGGITLGTEADLLADVIVGSGESAGRRVAADPDVDLDLVTDVIADAVAGGVLGIDFSRPA